MPRTPPATSGSSARTDGDGSWEAGVDGAEAGIAMLAKPRVGDGYRQGLATGVAEDRATVLSLDESVNVEAGSYADVLQIEVTTPLAPSGSEHRYYARGVGLVHQESAAGGFDQLELADLHPVLTLTRSKLSGGSASGHCWGGRIWVESGPSSPGQGCCGGPDGGACWGGLRGCGRGRRRLLGRQAAGTAHRKAPAAPGSTAPGTGPGRLAPPPRRSGRSAGRILRPARRPGRRAADTGAHPAVRRSSAPG